ncbi:MAG: 5'/3'-nucleotidase SurE [Candidatus Hodarchaeales archaeon]
MLFLITNDDGINAVGLKELASEMISIGDVVVVAPSTQQSGKGKSVTYTQPVRLHTEGEFMPDLNIHAYSVNGTPADSIIIGQKVCHRLFDKKPDLILSGINHGDNTSVHAIFTSGTCGAALEGGILGIPSIAFSLELPDDELFEKSPDSSATFKIAASRAKEIVSYVISHSFPDPVKVLNVNFPNTIDGNTKIKIVKLCPVKYIDKAIEALDPRNIPVYWLWGQVQDNLPKDTDSYVLINEKLITISPISLDLGSNHLQEIKHFFSDK